MEFRVKSVILEGFRKPKDIVMKIVGNFCSAGFFSIKSCVECILFFFPNAIVCDTQIYGY